MRTFLSLVFVLALLFSLTGCSKVSNRVIKIGLLESKEDSISAKELLGISYGYAQQSHVEIAGKTFGIKLIEVDCVNTAESGKTAAEKLVKQGVNLVIGSGNDQVSLAAADVFDEAGIPAIAPTSQSSSLTVNHESYFRMNYVTAFQGAVIAKYAWEQEITTAYLLGNASNEEEWGSLVLFEDSFSELGGDVIITDYPEGTTDFAKYFKDATEAEAGIVFVPSLPEYATDIIASAVGYEGEVFGSAEWENDATLEAAKGKDVNLKLATVYYEDTNKDFTKEFKEFSGESSVDASSALAYDAYCAAVHAMKNALSNSREDIRSSLITNAHAGITGMIVFGENGSVTRSSAAIHSVDTKTGTWKHITMQSI